MKIPLLNEVLIPVGDYFRVSQCREFIYEWFLPFLISIGAGFLMATGSTVDQVQKLNSVVVNFSAILVGFSVAALSIISASSGGTIQDLKETQTKRRVLGKKISLYRLVLINFIYVLFIEFMVVLLGVAHLMGQHLMSLKCTQWAYLPILFLFIHAVFLNFRNLTHFYFCFSKSTPKKLIQPTSTAESDNTSELVTDK